MTIMFPIGNAASTNINVALFTVFITLLDGMGRIFKRIQKLLEWDNVVNFAFIRDMFSQSLHRCI